jgi:immune inhibitor A
MKRWTVFPLVVVVLSLVAVAALDRPSRPSSSSSLRSSSRGFSPTPLRPGVREALKAHGKSLDIAFPNSINRGRKFNPGGGVVGSLSTARDQKVLVIFVEFSDVPPGGPAARLDLAYFDAMLFGTTYDPVEYAAFPGHPTDRTLRNYYEAVSYGNVDIVTLNIPSTTGWANTGKPYDFYCKADGLHDNGFGAYPNNAQGLVEDAVKALDAKIDFSQYAVDGEVPNLFVVHAGGGAEWSGDPRLLWSHSWSLDAGTGMTGGMTVDGVKVNNYAMMPELGGDLTGYTGTASGPFPPTVGVYAHEYGHVLGLPDQYDYGYESDGTGIYSLMAGGSWNQWPFNPKDDSTQLFSGNSPAFLDAWSRYRLGFVTPTVVSGPTDITLAPAESSPALYKMVVPNSGGKEYFLFENRQQIGFDEGLNVYGTYPGDTQNVGADIHGLAIYHVDDVVMNGAYWRPNEAENWKEFRSEGSKKAPNGATHYGISLVQADDRWDLEKGYYGGYRGDLFPGLWQVTSFGNTTRPNSSSYYFWAGSAPKFGYSGVTVTGISEVVGGAVSATLSFVPAK